jgi:hypothetical protein
MEDFMERRDFEQHPEDLEQVADWLRAQRPEVNALELDRIKQRALAQATRGERTSRGRRPLATALTALVLTASFGGAFAIAGKVPPSSPTSSGGSQTSAATTQYKPGKGCGKPGDHQQPPPKPGSQPCK